MVSEFVFTFFFFWVFNSWVRPSDIGLQVLFCKKKDSLFLSVGNGESFRQVDAA